METNFIKELIIDQDHLTEDSYIKKIPVLKALTSLKFHSNLTYFVGENGSGKSTVLEGIAVAYGFNPEGGTKNFNFSTNNTHSELSDAIRLVKGYKKPRDGFFLRAESFYNVASEIDNLERERSGYLAYYGGMSLHHQSHGESFLSLVKNRFRDHGLYLLDEPEAALSPQRQLSLFILIHQFLKSGCQFFIATHSPILLSIPGAEILNFDDEYIKRIHYEEAECYKVMEMFINNKELIIKNLISEPDE